MSDIQIPSTIAADTGTGKLFTPYRLVGDVAEYVESGASGIPATFTMRRTEPKATKDYAGAGRTEVKYTEQVADALGRLWPNVVTVTSSIPAFQTDADKTAFVTRAILATSVSVTRDALAKRTIPQS